MSDHKAADYLSKLFSKRNKRVPFTDSLFKRIEMLGKTKYEQKWYLPLYEGRVYMCVCMCNIYLLSTQSNYNDIVFLAVVILLRIIFFLKRKANYLKIY